MREPLPHRDFSIPILCDNRERALHERFGLSRSISSNEQLGQVYKGHGDFKGVGTNGY